MEFLGQAVIYLAAAIVCVPVAKKLGMGSVLGYLLAGILIGPFVMGFIGSEGKDIMHFAEFGVVMMLFLIGLELEPAHIWRMRQLIAGMGLLQLCGTAILIFIVAYALRFPWQASLAISLALPMSSTAIVLQSLKEKGLMNTMAGNSSFAVLLFQDISVIPILAFLPLIALSGPTVVDPSHHTLLEGLPGWMKTFSVVLSVALVILSGRYIIVPLLRLIARTHLRELFTASALLIVLAIAYLMEVVGLSPALGTFLAGVVLANSEYRHELESDLEPFKGLLLGLFFIAVGASINFELVADNTWQLFIIVAATMFIKALVLFITGKIFDLKFDQNLLFAIGLSQVGEFAFVLFSFINELNILSTDWVNLMMAATAISMTITPLLLLINEKLINPRLALSNKEEREADIVTERHRVIIAGFSHFGSTIGRFLRANKIECTILDNDSDQVDLLRKMGFQVHYGDATRADLMESAGANEAEILIIAINDPTTTARLAEMAKKHFPNLEIMVRAQDRMEAYEIMDLGLRNIYRDKIDTSIRLGVDVLKKLGFRSYTATRLGQSFFKYDEEALWRLAKSRHDMKQYISDVKQEIAWQEEILSGDAKSNYHHVDHAWDSDIIRETINSKTL
jgi:CPA2 family monovalent cation:H+ antiporter-2